MQNGGTVAVTGQMRHKKPLQSIKLN